MLRARIAGTGSYVPKKVLTNHDLEAMVDTTDKWISSRTGIKERHICTKETNTDMAVKAARIALKSASISPKRARSGSPQDRRPITSTIRGGWSSPEARGPGRTTT